MKSEDEVRTGVKVRCLFSFSRFGGHCQMRRNAWAPTKCYQFYLFGSLSSNHSLGLHVYFCPNYSSTNFLTFSILFHNLSAHRPPNQVMVLPHQQLDLWLVLCGRTGGGGVTDYHEAVQLFRKTHADIQHYTFMNQVFIMVFWIL